MGGLDCHLHVRVVVRVVEGLDAVDDHLLIRCNAIVVTIHGTGSGHHIDFIKRVPHETPGRRRDKRPDARMPGELIIDRTEVLVRPNLRGVRDAPPVAGVVRIVGRRAINIFVHKNNRDHVCEMDLT